LRHDAYADEVAAVRRQRGCQRHGQWLVEHDFPMKAPIVCWISIAFAVTARSISEAGTVEPAWSRMDYVVHSPTFSPDGRRIAFVMRVNANLPNCLFEESVDAAW